MNKSCSILQRRRPTHGVVLLCSYEIGNGVWEKVINWNEMHVQSLHCISSLQVTFIHYRFQRRRISFIQPEIGMGLLVKS